MMYIRFEKIVENGIVPLLEEIADSQGLRFVAIVGPKPDIWKLILYDVEKGRVKDDTVLIVRSNVVHSPEPRRKGMIRGDDVTAAFFSLLKDLKYRTIFIQDPPIESDDVEEQIKAKRNSELITMEYSNMPLLGVMIADNEGEIPEFLLSSTLFIKIGYPSLDVLNDHFPEELVKKAIGLPIDIAIKTIRTALSISQMKPEETVSMVKRNYLRSRGFRLFVPKITWNDIGGGKIIDGEPVGYRLKVMIDLKSLGKSCIDFAEGRINSKPPNRIMIYGPEGIGKTTFVEAFASMFPLAQKFLLTQFLSKYVGEGEKKLREALSQAAAFVPIPTVVVMEDVDALASQTSESGVGDVYNNFRREISVFLEENPEVTFIATVSDPGKLSDDVKVLFERIIPLKRLDPRTNEGKIEFLDVLGKILEKYNTDLDAQLIFENVPSVREFERPLDFKRLLDKAAQLGKGKITIKHVRAAAKIVKKTSTDSRTERIFNMMDTLFK